MNSRNSTQEDRRYFINASEFPLGASWIGKSYCSNKYRMVRKRSTATAINYIVDGEGYVVKNGKSHLVTADTVCIFYANEAHHYYASPQNPWTIIWMLLPGELTNTLAKAYGISDEFAFDGKGVKYIFDKIATLVYNDEITNFDCQKTIASSYIKLLMELKNQVHEKNHHPNAVKIKKFLDENTHRLVGNEELANLVFHSSDYCIKLFKKEYGATPYDYQLKQKMDIACKMLQQTDTAVFEIASSLGYNDAQYFSGLFKSKCGIAPGAYRKKYK